ncbi:MAG TPA: hypothetical protein PK109_03150 [Candidatus Paceibacterota bacterium]|nr:hypothetical protein [Candidatus Paceibacterota bacterium]
MEHPNEYIDARLARLNVVNDLPTFANDEERKTFIVKTILSKKYRKYAVDGDFLPHLEGALEYSFKNGKPLQFVYPFGGYKLWRLDESPEADWAELFTMMHNAAWLKSIAHVYEPGVWFDFSPDDVIVERMNHIPKADTDAYRATFNEVIAFITPYLPENLKFTLTPVGSRYTPEEFDADLTARTDELLAQNHGKLPQASDAEKAMMDLNAKRTPEELADPEWYGKNKLMHDAYMATSKRRPYNRAPEKILTFTKALPKGVAIGSTKTSIAKFWAGVGALKKRDDSYIETILSPEQIKAASATWEPISIGLKGKNFSKIRIIESS